MKDPALARSRGVGVRIQAACPRSPRFRSSQYLCSSHPQAQIRSRQIKSALNDSSLSKPYAPRVTCKALYGPPLPPCASPLPCAPVTWPPMPFSILGSSALLSPSVMLLLLAPAPHVPASRSPLTTPSRSLCVSLSPARPPQSLSNSPFCSTAVLGIWGTPLHLLV